MAAVDAAIWESRLAYLRGIVVLHGPALDRTAAAGSRGLPAAWLEQRRKRDGDEHHATALTKQDLQRVAQGIRDDTIQVPEGLVAPDLADLTSVAAFAIAMLQRQPSGLAWADAGEGRASTDGCEAVFRVILWPGGAAARRALQLPPHDFHTTLGFNGGDVHCKSKGLTALAAGSGRMDLAALPLVLQLAARLLEVPAVEAADEEGVRLLGGAALEAARLHGDAAFEAAALRLLCQLFARQRNLEESVTCARQLTELSKEDVFGWRNLAFALLGLQRFDEALPALRWLRWLLPGMAPGKERSQLEKWLPLQLQKCRRKLELEEAEPLFPGPEDRVTSEWDEAFEAAFLRHDDSGLKLKFPSTGHIKNLGAATKDDKILGQDRARQFCGSGRPIYIEEKIDGANLGISLSSNYTWRMQARGKWANWNTDPQFAGLEEFLETHRQTLTELLERNNDILFGEWCFARHTVKYKRLPAYFLAFDIFDWRAGKFLSREAFHRRLSACTRGPRIMAVPMLANRQVFRSIEDVMELLHGQSAFADDVLEGVYLRLDDEPGSRGSGEDTYLVDRCKLVNAAFKAAIEDGGSWRGSGRNGLDVEGALSYADTCYPCAPSSTTVREESVSTTKATSPAARASAGQGQDLRMTLTNPRERHTVSAPGLGDVELPRNFSFLLDDLAVSSEPRNRSQIIAMGSMGIGLVITLTEESPLPAEWFIGTGVTNSFVPVTNYHPPSSEQMTALVAEVGAAVVDDKKVMVHCGGGKGRAGTVAACLMARFGTESIGGALRAEEQDSDVKLCPLASNELMAYLREQRPGSIERERQEHFLRDFVSHLRRLAADEPEALSLHPHAGAAGRAAATVTAASAQASTSARSNGDTAEGAKPKAAGQAQAGGKKDDSQKHLPKYIMMVGLVASGKSTLSQALEASELYARANQDEDGRDGCLDKVRKTAPLVRQGKARLVLDRCNLTQKERREWLEACGTPPAADVLCIFVDTPAEECKRRAASRKDHATIKGSGGRVIDAQAKQLERPEKGEGFGKIEVVADAAQAAALLRRLGAEPPLPAAAAVSGTPDEVMPEGIDLEVAAEERAGAAADDRRSDALPEAFTSWLRLALSEELGEDAEGILASVQVILEGIAEDPEALVSCCEVVRDCGAPLCAERLGARWQAAVT